MRHSQLSLLLGFALSLTLLAGCGSDSSGPTEAADLDEISQFVADNPGTEDDQEMEDEE